MQIFRIVVSVFLALIVVAYAFSRPLSDFMEYWTSAHLLVAHQNPYSLPDTFQMQQALGWREPIPLIPLNPPWVLAVIAPLGLASSYELAWLVWVVLLTGIVAISSRLLMDLYFGELRVREISDSAKVRCLMAFTFYPTLLALKFAQTAPLLLLGLSGFLYFESKRKSIAASVFLSLTLIKPQLVILIWLAVLLNSWQRRWLKTLLPTMSVIAILTTIALLLDHQVLKQYWEIASGPYAQIYPSGMTAMIRRAFGGRSTFWLQFVLPVIGVIWFATYWRKHRSHWNWTDRMPMLVTVSMLTTAWGWLFDQTILAIPIIALAATHAKILGQIPRDLVIWYTALNIILIFAAMLSSPWAFMPAPILAAALLIRDARRGIGVTIDTQPRCVGTFMST
jgi:hypothetical protein